MHACITERANAPFALLAVDFAVRKRYRANGKVLQLTPGNQAINCHAFQLPLTISE